MTLSQLFDNIKIKEKEVGLLRIDMEDYLAQEKDGWRVIENRWGTIDGYSNPWRKEGGFIKRILDLDRQIEFLRKSDL